MLVRNDGKGDGGLILVPKSHTIDWRQHFPEETAKVSRTKNWFKIPTPVKGVIECKDVIRPVCSEPGVMLIWRSDLVHANIPPSLTSTQGGRERCVLFVSMQSKSKATPRVLKKRREYASTGRTTAHWSATFVKVNGEGKPWRSKNQMDTKPFQQSFVDTSDRYLSEIGRKRKRHLIG